MKRQLLSTTALATMLIFASVSAIAQADARSGIRTESRSDFVFRGGSLERLVAQLQRDPENKLNVLLSPDARGFQVDEMRLKSVKAADVILAVAKAYPQLQATTEGEITILSLRPANQVRFRMFSLKTVLKDVKIEDLNTLIRNAWELVGIGKKAKLRYHAETQILIVAGLPPEIEAVETVLKELSSRGNKE